MPEGHSVHRIARQFARHFVDAGPVAVSSPQGRFAADARLVDGHAMTQARAVGKQMFLEFDNGLWLRVHLGMYGAWDFAGDITVDDTTASAGGRMGQTNQRGTVVGATGTGERGVSAHARRDTVVGAHEDSVWSIGAPRRTRIRMAESERLEPEITEWPPEPIGQVRARLLTASAVADLRGPTVCEVIDAAAVARVIAALGPDPLVDRGRAAEQRFVDAVRAKSTPIGLLLMDQSVVSGIGNVYRAELLFRARQSPFTPGRLVPEDVVGALWRDWAKLLRIGVETGQMLTMDGLRGEARRRALAHRDDRHWVYHRTGEPCRVCGTPIAMQVAAGRKLYWCPSCQA
ncbi:MAG: DNA glycosylase [Micrococcales bacterium 73-13]|nr:MAG: DNA glycosylase [Micrococcales bacterium 73-13]